MHIGLDLACFLVWGAIPFKEEVLGLAARLFLDGARIGQFYLLDVLGHLLLELLRQDGLQVVLLSFILAKLPSICFEPIQLVGFLLPIILGLFLENLFVYLRLVEGL